MTLLQKSLFVTASAVLWGFGVGTVASSWLHARGERRAPAKECPVCGPVEVHGCATTPVSVIGPHGEDVEPRTKWPRGSELRCQLTDREWVSVTIGGCEDAGPTESEEEIYR